MESWHIFLAIVVVGLVVAIWFLRDKLTGGSVKVGDSGASFKTVTGQPGVKAADIKSTGGKVTAADETGRGTDAQRIEATGDISLTSKPPPKS